MCAKLKKPAFSPMQKVPGLFTLNSNAMKIENSAIRMSGTRFHEESRVRKEVLRVWVDEVWGQPEENASFAESLKLIDITEISENSKKIQFTAVEGRQGLEEAITPEELRLKTLLAMLRALLDKDFQAVFFSDKQGKKAEEQEQVATETIPSQNSSETEQSVGGWFTSSHESVYESEKTTFSAEGVIKTSDGKEILIDVDLSMNRSFYKEEFIAREERAVKDPLVINYNGNAVQVTETKFSFDVDADGTTDKISFVEEGSGFLALDKNNDGAINDGNELFGAKTGDGFAELSAYDEDENGWIDENDSVFDKLRVWTKDENGEKRLVGLLDVDAGALYLGRASTPFAIKDAENNTQAEVVSTGVYLREDGDAGTLQQVNLVV